MNPRDPIRLAPDDLSNDAYRLHILLDCTIDKVVGNEAGALVALASELALSLSERIGTTLKSGDLP